MTASLAERLDAYLTRTGGQPAKVLKISRISGGGLPGTVSIDVDLDETLPPTRGRR